MVRRFYSKDDITRLSGVLDNLWISREHVDQYEELKQIAYEQDTSFSAFIRTLLPSLHALVRQAWNDKIPADQLGLHVVGKAKHAARKKG